MNKKSNSPFLKVTKFVATKNGTDFVFQATDEKELLLSTDILSEAISLQKLEETISEGNKKIYRRKMRPIIGISGDSYWTLELIRRYFSNIDNKFRSLSKIVDIHMSSYWLYGSDLNEFEKNEEIKAEKLTEAYNSLRRLIYVKSDNGERMMEFRVPELTNSSIPIWRSAMLALFAPHLLLKEEFEELLSLVSEIKPLNLSGGSLDMALYKRLTNESIDFNKVNKLLLIRKNKLIKEWEEENQITYDPRKFPRSSRFEENRDIKKYEQYTSLSNAQIRGFNKRFKRLQEIAKKQGVFFQG